MFDEKVPMKMSWFPTFMPECLIVRSRDVPPEFEPSIVTWSVPTIMIELAEGIVMVAVTPAFGLTVSVRLEFRVPVVRLGELGSVMLPVMRKVTGPEAPLVLRPAKAAVRVAYVPPGPTVYDPLNDCALTSLTRNTRRKPSIM